MQVSDSIHLVNVIDPLHIAWRIRRQYLDPRKNLSFGGLIITHNKLLAMAKHLGLTNADLDPSNKQSWEGIPNYVS